MSPTDGSSRPLSRQEEKACRIPLTHHWLFNRLGVFAICAILLPAIQVLTITNPTLQAGGLDPYFYTGYIFNHKSLFELFGPTYYGNRISFIYPARLAVTLFGDQTGPLVSRFVFLMLGTSAVFGLALNYSSIKSAAFVAIWFCFNPWPVRAIMWDYPDGAVLAYLLLTIYLVTSIHSRVVLAHAAAGAVFSFALNSNPMALLVGAAFLPTWLVIHWRAKLLKWLSYGSVFVIGAALCYIVIMCAQYLEAPDLGFGRELTTWMIALNFAKGGAAAWSDQLGPILGGGRLYILLPPFTLMLTLLTFSSLYRVRQYFSRPLLAAALFLAITIGAYLCGHFIFNAGIIVAFYYFVYICPAVVFSLIAILADLGCSASNRALNMVYGAGVAVVLGIWFFYASLSGLIETLSIVAYVGAAILALVAIYQRRCKTLSLAGLLLVFICANIIFYHKEPGSNWAGRYSLIHDRSQRLIENDVYRGTLFLIRFVEQFRVQATGNIGFWYSNARKDLYLNSVQSAYLWGYSRVFGGAPETGMPIVDKATLRVLDGYEHLVLLGRSSADIEAGIEALRNIGEHVTVLHEGRFEGDAFNFSAAIIGHYPPRRQLGVVRAELTTALEATGGTVEWIGHIAQIVTIRERWGYSAIVDLSNRNLPRRPLVLSVRLKVESGSIGIGVDERENPSHFIEKGATVTREPVNIYIDIDDPGRAGKLIIRNWSARGRSIVRIFSIEVADPR